MLQQEFVFTNGGYYKNKIKLKWRFAFLGDSSLSKKLSLTSLIDPVFNAVQYPTETEPLNLNA